MRITWHKHLTAVTGLGKRRLTECRLARTEITARRTAIVAATKVSARGATIMTATEVATGSAEVAARCGCVIACTGKTVIETALALIATAFWLATETAAGVTVIETATVGIETTGTTTTTAAAKIAAA